jgi:hypothetical protein
MDGAQLVDSIGFELLQAEEEKTKTTRGQVPPFEIIPINPDDHPREWGTARPNLSNGSSPDEQSLVAYKAVRIEGGIYVYYSTIFTPLSEQMEKLTAGSSALAEMFRTNYEIWIGYHEILQENSKCGGPLG